MWGASFLSKIKRKIFRQLFLETRLQPDLRLCSHYIFRSNIMECNVKRLDSTSFLNFTMLRLSIILFSCIHVRTLCVFLSFQTMLFCVHRVFIFGLDILYFVRDLNPCNSLNKRVEIS